MANFMNGSIRSSVKDRIETLTDGSGSSFCSHEVRSKSYNHMMKS